MSVNWMGPDLMSPVKDKCGIEGHGVALGSQEVEWDREEVLYAASAQQACFLVLQAGVL